VKKSDFAKYKIGDKVIVIDDDNGLDSDFYNIGDYGTIFEIRPDHYEVVFSYQKDHPAGHLWSVSEEQLAYDELAETPLRKVLEE
jgi:nicotinic acid phosphoribosyltransferase